MTEVFWNIDHLIINTNQLYGHGWIFHSTHEITKIQFRLSSAEADGCETKLISADGDKPRADVHQNFKNHPHALYSGYVVYGSFLPSTQIKSIDILCSISDGSIITLPVPKSIIRRVNIDDKPKTLSKTPRKTYLFNRGMKLLLEGKFAILFAKAGREIKKNNSRALKKPEDLRSLLHRKDCKNLHLIFDHQLGGGANAYSQRLIDSFISDGYSVVIVSYDISNLSHVLIFRNKKVNYQFKVPNKDFIFEACKGLPIGKIIYNNAVSFAEPEKIPSLIIKIKQACNSHLRVLVHDFFPICPSHFLLNENGIHCDLPDISSCSQCISKNEQSFTSLFHERDIFEWRSQWGELLSISDEIVTFSHNSADLLFKAYPKIEKEKVLITPHTVTYLSERLPQVSDKNVLRIGVIGHIANHKGSLFIKSLAEEIKLRNFDINIIIIGVIETKCDAMIVKETGSYRHSELTRLIEESGANVFLFPSIWPETFSYVTEELMQMHLPVASFNIGAPAERLKTYQKGLILNSMNPDKVLDELILFHKKLYLKG